MKGNVYLVKVILLVYVNNVKKYRKKFYKILVIKWDIKWEFVYE